MTGKMLLLLLFAVLVLILLWSAFVPEFHIVRVRAYPARIGWALAIVLVLLGLIWLWHKVAHVR